MYHRSRRLVWTRTYQATSPWNYDILKSPWKKGHPTSNLHKSNWASQVREKHRRKKKTKNRNKNRNKKHWPALRGPGGLDWPFIPEPHTLPMLAFSAVPIACRRVLDALSTWIREGFTCFVNHSNKGRPAGLEKKEDEYDYNDTRLVPEKRPSPVRGSSWQFIWWRQETGNPAS